MRGKVAAEGAGRSAVGGVYLYARLSRPKARGPSSLSLHWSSGTKGVSGHNRPRLEHVPSSQNKESPSQHSLEACGRQAVRGTRVVKAAASGENGGPGSKCTMLWRRPEDAQFSGVSDDQISMTTGVCSKSARRDPAQTARVSRRSTNPPFPQGEHETMLRQRTTRTDTHGWSRAGRFLAEF